MQQWLTGVGGRGGGAVPYQKSGYTPRLKGGGAQYHRLF